MVSLISGPFKKKNKTLALQLYIYDRVEQAKKKEQRKGKKKNKPKDRIPMRRS